jgi:23S rRNA pseudouridine2605 synthase
MRINKLLAQATGLSRRAADQAIQAGRVNFNGQPARVGDSVTAHDRITLDGQIITAAPSLTILLNKPVDYVCSRSGQGSRTIYDLLPSHYRDLKPVGRLDKASSGLLLLTNDGDLAQQLTHPRYAKTKVYEITLDKPLSPAASRRITETGVSLSDGLSRFALAQLKGSDQHWRVTMSEGRNRQIRRTFASLGYGVTALHRRRFGPYYLGELPAGQYTPIKPTRSREPRRD